MTSDFGEPVSAPGPAVRNTNYDSMSSVFLSINEWLNCTQLIGFVRAFVVSGVVRRWRSRGVVIQVKLRLSSCPR